MIEMPNSLMIPSNQETSSMDSNALITTTVMTMAATPNNTMIDMPEDMKFNAGHLLSIIVYRFDSHTKLFSDT